MRPGAWCYCVMGPVARLAQFGTAVSSPHRNEASSYLHTASCAAVCCCSCQSTLLLLATHRPVWGRCTSAGGGYYWQACGCVAGLPTCRAAFTVAANNMDTQRQQLGDCACKQEIKTVKYLVLVRRNKRSKLQSA